MVCLTEIYVDDQTMPGVLVMNLMHICRLYVLDETRFYLLTRPVRDP